MVDLFPWLKRPWNFDNVDNTDHVQENSRKFIASMMMINPKQQISSRVKPVNPGEL